jgi:hypothetical protein
MIINFVVGALSIDVVGERTALIFRLEEYGIRVSETRLLLSDSQNSAHHVMNVGLLRITLKYSVSVRSNDSTERRSQRRTFNCMIFCFGSILLNIGRSL